MISNFLEKILNKKKQYQILPNKINYYIGPLQFSQNEISELYKFFSTSDLADNDMSKETAVAIEIDNILKESPSHKIARKKIHKKYEQQHPEYTKELLNLSEAVDIAKQSVVKKIKSNYDYKLHENYKAGKITEDEYQKYKQAFNEKCYTHCKEESEILMNTRKKYDLKCAEAILDYFNHESLGILNSTEDALQKYALNEDLPM